MKLFLNFGFFLLHIVSTKVLVPVTNMMVMSLLQNGLPSDPSFWGPLITDMKEFSHLLHHYFSDNFLTYKVLTHLALTLKKLLQLFFYAFALPLTIISMKLAATFSFQTIFPILTQSRSIFASGLSGITIRLTSTSTFIILKIFHLA